MNAVIVGLGSMGRRRVRLLQKYDASIVIIGVDTQKERRTQAEKELQIRTAESIEDACNNENIDIAFISTSPLSHASIIKECLNQNLHIFTELNLVFDGYDENLKRAAEKEKVLFLSSTFLYRKEILYIKEAVKKYKGRLSYIYHAGQYLPDWHPWENYKNFFVGKKETNGCREFMAIEFPWMIDVFGKIKGVYASNSKNSTLDIDFPDSYQIIFEHENGHRGMISIDVVSRKAVRNFELFGEEIYLTWDGTPDGLVRYDYKQRENEQIRLYKTIEKRPEYSASIIEDAYLSEISNFMDVINGRAEAKYSFEKDKEILAIIDKIEGR